MILQEALMGKGKNFWVFSWTVDRHRIPTPELGEGQLGIMEHHGWAVHLIFTAILIGHHCPMTMVLGEMLKSRNSNRILGNEFLQAMLYSDTWNEIQDHGFSETWCPLCVCVSLYVSVCDSVCV